MLPYTIYSYLNIYLIEYLFIYFSNLIVSSFHYKISPFPYVVDDTTLHQIENKDLKQKDIIKIKFKMYDKLF